MVLRLQNSVTPPLEPLGSETCCQPGDITVSKIHSGYLIGRALAPIGPGPWWTFLAVVRTFREAVHHALTIARHDDVRAWLQLRADEYEPLTEVTKEP